MISQVSGRLATRDVERVEITTSGGVTYEVAIPLGTFEALPPRGDQVTLCPIGIITFHFYRFIINEIPDTLLGFKVKLHPYFLIILIDQTKGMAAESMHMPVTEGRAAVTHQEHDLVQAFRVQAPEIPHHRGAFAIGIRFSFLGMDKVAEFFRILYEKYGGIISDKVPVSIFRIKF